MSQTLQILTRSLLNQAFILPITGSYYPAAAQNVLTGDWKASIEPEKSDEIHLSFERRAGR